MQASEIMSWPAVTVTPDTMLEHAVRLMLERRISGLPVVDAQGRPVGMLTEGDLLRRIETETERQRPRWLEFLASPGRLAQEYAQAHGRFVAEVMTQPVVGAPPEAPLETVVRLMQSRRVKRVPIVRDGVVVGIVSRADLIRVLAQRLPQDDAPVLPDEALASRVDAALRQAAWRGSRSVTARVQDGVVTLGGLIFDERERTAFCVLAENVPGVRSVEDTMVWVDPSSGVAMPDDRQAPPGRH